MVAPSRSAAYQRQYRHTDAYRAYRRAYARLQKHKTIAFLGGRCECCGETQIEFLEIDHVDGGGSIHRRGVTPYKYWADIRAGLHRCRVLCANCHAAVSNYGHCPHAV